MENKFSLADYASDKTRMAFVCVCKKCVNGMSAYVSPEVWLDIAYVLVQDDLLTLKEFKNLNHLAVSQWDLISEKINA
jgi:hypothetical protein